MDFDQAIASHADWKQRLIDYLKKRDHSLKASEIGLDTRCPLGKWIYGEGSKHVRRMEFSNMRIEHARFHRASAEVVRRADQGLSVSADFTVGAGTEFERASTAVVNALKAIKKCTE